MLEPQPDLTLTSTEAERILQAWLDDRVHCSAVVPLEGGMMNSVFRLEFDREPHRAVIKLHTPDGDPFAAEARALDHLATDTACPSPSVYLHDGSGHLVPHAFLLLEAMDGVCLKGLDLGPDDRDDIDRQLADVLVELHRHHGDAWGEVDNPSSSERWADVFLPRLADARAHPELAVRLGRGVLASVDRAIEVADALLDDGGTPTLVHGDVWEGNLMVARENGRWRLTGLLDPDLHYADVEVELAYLEVFDHRRTAFFSSYTTRQTLRPGYEHRRLIYWLHTALVHVGLFGDDVFCQFADRTADRIGRIQVS